MLYRYLLGLCGSPDIAEELVQETFYQAIKSMDRFDGSCKVSTWLCQIGKHMWYNEVRRRNQKAEVSLDETMDAHLVDSLSPEKKVIDQDSYRSLLGCIHHLPEDSKEVVLLRAMGGLSFKEIGEIMGKRENWARVTYFRAKQKLAEMEERNGL